ncbi:hypothetical protein NEOLEDRAFT_1163692 [Neolentinus lepideus HHB14362 ss-1]|uniref:Uncharacterized protein n=1 Tax=Neolentinus lepideus HHB14362 ss-1 TaxID=1314782 RepID=A0A165RB15_9AGAM|nr:hypothetical protein NEOLEDRAFT_1163692 [Neolentinus lepideus HHB14362 ss-1]
MFVAANKYDKTKQRLQDRRPCLDAGAVTRITSRDTTTFIALIGGGAFLLLPFINIHTLPDTLLDDSNFEAFSDYYGFPSRPFSIYHTGDRWPRPTGLEAYCVPKEARPVCIHPIATVSRWRNLGRQIYEYFDSVGLRSTSIDPVCIAEDAENAAVRCKHILAEFQITDVEIAFRESVFTRSAGPQHLNNVSSFHPTMDVRAPFTPALGLKIASKAYPHFESTDSLYLREGDERNRLLLLTTHVLEHCGEAIEGEDTDITEHREHYKRKLVKAEKSIPTLNEFNDKTTRFWSTETLRILVHIIHAPPISVGTDDKPFTEDWALIELDDKKIGWKDVKGNVIQLGTRIALPDFVWKIYSQVKSCTFNYSPGGLLQLQGVVEEDELRHPTMLDADGEPCLIVVMNGNITGETIGRATSIESFDGAFSAPGDFGSVIADANNRIVAILIGGAGKRDFTDVTYATPYYWVEEQIKKAFPDSYLYPATAA